MSVTVVVLRFYHKYHHKSQNHTHLHTHTGTEHRETPRRSHPDRDAHKQASHFTDGSRSTDVVQTGMLWCPGAGVVRAAALFDPWALRSLGGREAGPAAMGHPRGEAADGLYIAVTYLQRTS